ncbi:hypothetical protein [Mucilaginibacter ginkgonis]|uniref:Uncharacterized protein n=1 Tax=Mucilaginibacter ginkgonis TaxID=2682091 RepID=A0A6I4IMQ0_9SPHI|nr:hypothetical protein [Mucilaginibacter ginkgonis]QQL49909.1 hypothetical protein GO620_000210 [Mucilaginibacter ginkgonis]
MRILGLLKLHNEGKLVLQTVYFYYLKNFKYEYAGVEFEFRTVNSIKLQLFQVYYIDEGLKKRFHMQVDQNGDFFIAIKANCPEVVLSGEQIFSEAIKTNGTGNL